MTIPTKFLFLVILSTITVGSFGETGIGFSSSSYSFPEDSGEVTIDIVRTSDLFYLAGATITPIDGTAKIGRDFKARTSSVLFPPSSSKQSYTFSVLDNSVEESDKFFYLALSSSDATVSTALAKVTIANDDEWIPTDEYCSPNEDGTDYTGNVAQSISGKPCLNWYDLKDDHSFIRDISFKEGKITTAGNKCRNPETTMMPYGTWCYVKQGNTAVPEYCGVMRCASLQEHLRSCRDANKCSSLKQCAQNPACGVLSTNPDQLKVVANIGLDVSASTENLRQQINFAKAVWEWAASDKVFRACFLDLSLYSFTGNSANTQKFHIYYQNYPEARVAKEAKQKRFNEFIKSLKNQGIGGVTDLGLAASFALNNPNKELSPKVVNVAFIVSDFIHTVGGTNSLPTVVQNLRNQYINIVPVLMDKVWDPDSFGKFFIAKSAEIRMSVYGTTVKKLMPSIRDVMETMVNAKRRSPTI